MDDAHEGEAVAIVELCDARAQCSVRDLWLGWSPGERRRGLKSVFGVNALAVAERYAGPVAESHVVSLLSDTLVRSALRIRYGVDPVALEVRREVDDAPLRAFCTAEGAMSFQSLGRGGDVYLSLSGAAAAVVAEAAEMRDPAARDALTGIGLLRGNSALVRKGLSVMKLPLDTLRVAKSGPEVLIVPFVADVEGALRAVASASAR